MNNKKSPFAQELSTVLVEYIGSSPELLHKRYEGKVLKFAPHPAYHNRRVEEFPNEAEAVLWIKPFNKRHSTFQLVEDMLTEREQRRFDEHVGPLKQVIESQERRISVLEEQLAEMKDQIETQLSFIREHTGAELPDPPPKAKAKAKAKAKKKAAAS